MFLNRIIETRLIDWRKIEPLQPDNAKIKINESWLKESLSKFGFAMPFYGWEHKGKIYCIDGHTRKEILLGFENVPDKLPCTFIDAKDKKEAVKILVSVFNQKHNQFDNDILTEWLEVEEIPIEEIDIESVNVEYTNEEINKKEAKEDDFELEKFIEYWSEKSKSGKMKYEFEKTWEGLRRLE